MLSISIHGLTLFYPFCPEIVFLYHIFEGKNSCFTLFYLLTHGTQVNTTHQSPLHIQQLIGYILTRYNNRIRKVISIYINVREYFFYVIGYRMLGICNAMLTLEDKYNLLLLPYIPTIYVISNKYNNSIYI